MKTFRLQDVIDDTPCPFCLVPIKARCRTREGRVLAHVHQARMFDYRHKASVVKDYTDLPEVPPTVTRVVTVECVFRGDEAGIDMFRGFMGELRGVGAAEIMNSRTVSDSFEEAMAICHRRALAAHPKGDEL